MIDARREIEISGQWWPVPSVHELKRWRERRMIGDSTRIRDPDGTVRTVGELMLSLPREWPYQIYRDGAYYPCPDLATLRLWVHEGRVEAEGPVFVTLENRWMRARELVGGRGGPLALWHRPEVIVLLCAIVLPLGLVALWTAPPHRGLFGSTVGRAVFTTLAVVAVAAGWVWFGRTFIALHEGGRSCIV